MRNPSHSKKKHRRRAMCSWGCGLAVVVGCLGLLPVRVLSRQYSRKEPAESRNGDSHRSKEVSAISDSSLPSLVARPLYPYSVIPGGVENASELRRAVAADPVVARHYADFDLGKTTPVRLSSAREAYVSYRIGNHIYWTNHKLKLAVGETLLTDGTREARTRCGNRVSYVPQMPVSPVEPLEGIFDSALPLVAMAIPEFDIPFDSSVTGLTAPASDSSSPSAPFGGGFSAFNSPIARGGVGSSGTPSTPPATGGGSTPFDPGGTDGDPGMPPVATPEPSAAALLAAGLGLLFLFFLRRGVKT
jgi:hypothetical protein